MKDSFVASTCDVFKRKHLNDNHENIQIGYSSLPAFSISHYSNT